MSAIETTGSKPRIDPDTPRGSYIPPEEFERVFGDKRNTSAYAWKLLAIQGRFTSETVEGGDPKISRVYHGGLLVMPDQEASEYLDQRIRATLRTTVDLVGRLDYVRVDRLGDDQRAAHDARVRRHSAMAQGIKEKYTRDELTGSMINRALTD